MAEESSGKTIKIKIPSMPKIDIWRILTIVFATIILAQIFGLFNLTGLLGLPASTQLSNQQIGEKVINYINQNLVQPGTTASLVSVNDKGSFYEVVTSYQGNRISVYASKDGSYLFLQAFDMNQQLPRQEAQEEQPQQQVPKTDRPEARVFVMSYCPYGLQFLKAYIPVIELLGNKADLYVNFVDYIMHGEKEMIENTRMYCIQKEQRDKFTAYLRCFVQSGDAEKCIAEAKIDKAKLDACMEATDKQYNLTGLFKGSGATFPPYPIDSDLNDKYGVRGSPTFVLNGVTISVNRAAESIKQAICSAFTTLPAECSQTLSTSTEAPGIGAIGSGSGASSSGGCA
ncbi:MAG: hypothetical protein QXL86_03445 [Candidatus Aenigmatarchaeota archaeon]